MGSEGRAGRSEGGAPPLPVPRSLCEGGAKTTASSGDRSRASNLIQASLEAVDRDGVSVWNVPVHMEGPVLL